MTGKKSICDMALWGGDPTFKRPLHVGQLNLPDWGRFKESMQGIFDRRFYTNHGPLVHALEQQLAEYLNVKHVVCMSNGTLALMMAAKALEITGEVIVPSFTFAATVQALTWAGLEPCFCDVDPERHTITDSLVKPLVSNHTSAILGVHLWGRSCYSEKLQALADSRGIKLFFDSAHAIGCTHAGKMIGGFGEVEVFSMHATKILNSAEGGFASTNNTLLANRMKTIRNFHGTGTYAEVPLRINAKMSEAQAAMGLLSLEDLPRNISRNTMLHTTYSQHIAGIGGLSVIPMPSNEQSNYQYLLLDVDAELTGVNRDDLVQILNAEGVVARRYFYPGVHQMPPYCELYPQYRDTLPVTDELGSRLMQLPVGQAISQRDVEKICEVLEFCVHHGHEIRDRLCNNAPDRQGGGSA